MKRLFTTLLVGTLLVAGRAIADVNFDVQLNSSQSSAISGDTVDFDITLVNNTGIDCDTTLYYSLSNGISGYDTSETPNRRPLMPGFYQLDPNPDTYNINIETYIKTRDWDNDFGITVNGSYICSGMTNTGIINSGITGTYLTSLYLEPKPELSLIKTLISDNPHNPGDDVIYQVDITNLGSTTVSGFNFIETFPHGLISYDIPGSVCFPTPTGCLPHTQWLNTNNYMREGNYLNIDPGNTLTITVHGELQDNTNAIIGTTIPNTASIINLPAGDTNSNNADSADAIITNSDLDISVTAITTEVSSLHDPIVFEISYNNINGNLSGQNVQINGFMNYIFGDNDGIRKFVSNDWLTYQSAGQTTSGANILWSDLPGDIGTNQTFTITGYFDTGFDYNIGNDQLCFYVNIHGDMEENLPDNKDNNQAYACIDIVAPTINPPDINFSMNVWTPLNIGTGRYAISGSEAELTIDIENNGTNPFNGSVECEFPTTNALYTETNPEYYRNGDNDTVIRNSPITINAGNTHTLTLTGIISLQERENYNITCFLKSGDINLGNVQLLHYTGVNILPIPDIQVTKELVSTNPTNPNDPINFNITITNIGSQSAINYNLLDDLPIPPINIPANVTMNFQGTDRSHTENMGNTYLRQGGYLDLEPGDNINVIANFTLDGQATEINQCFTNQARITGINPEYDTSNNTAIALGCVDAPNLGIEIITLGDSPESIYDEVAFQITITNTGNIASSGTFIDGFIQDLVFGNNGGQRNITSDQFRNINSTSTGRNLDRITLPSLDANNGNLVILVTGYLNSDGYTPGAPICLSATVGSNIPEYLNNNYLNNSAEACHTISGSIIDLSITKTLQTNLSTVVENDTIVYRIDIQNDGTDNAINLELTDILPGFITYDTSSLSIPGTCAVQANGSVFCNNFSLNANETAYLIITGHLNISPTQEIILTNTGMIFSSSMREYNTGNNIYSITDIVPTLADIIVSKTVTSDNPSNNGDEITYQIHYENIGGRTATGVVIYDNLLFSGLDYIGSTPASRGRDVNTNSGHRGPINLDVGASGTINITTRLNDRYASGTLLPNMAFVTSSSQEITTDNNTAYATGIIEELKLISISVDAFNIDHPSIDRNGEPVYAISGDQVQFTINYFNSGNVNLNDVVIGFQLPYNIPGLQQNYNRAIGSLPFGSGGTFILTGIVGPQGFAPLTGEAFIRHSNQFDAEDSDTTVVIELPPYCGDGFMTANEDCDILGPIGIIRPGQECLPINPNTMQGGCHVVTTSIVNTGCIDFGYNIGGNYVNSHYCVDININIEPASCDEVIILDEITIGNTGLDVQFNCLGLNTISSTHIQMDCGNGETLENYGNLLSGTCHYVGEEGEITQFDGQCTVGYDNDNPNCAMPISINAPDQAMCDTLIPQDGTVLLVDENDRDGELDFRCETIDGIDADLIEIDCNYDRNGGNFEADFYDRNTNQLDVNCEFDRGEEETYRVACRVNEVDIEENCEELIIVDTPSLQDCGDGIRQGREQCDLTEDGDYIREYNNGYVIDQDLDDQNNNDAGRYGDGDYYCRNCAIRGLEVDDYQPPACFNINTNISIQLDEIFPFRWNLETDNIDNRCKPGNIKEDTMRCTFAIYNGTTNLQKDHDPLRDEELDCNTDERDEDEMFQYFEEKTRDIYMSLAMKSPGKYKVDVNDFALQRELGEHKLVLESVEYEYCTNDEEREKGNIVDRVCEVNFAVTKPYLMQKSAFGASKVESSKINLEDFYNIQGDNIIESTDLKDVMSAEAYDYDGGSEIEKLIESFVSKYEKLAITIKDYGAYTDTTDGLRKISKVPGQQIYVFEGDSGAPLTLKQKTTFYPNEPFTIIVKGMNLVIEGSVVTNGMFLVQDGTINFKETEEDKCIKPQIANGIFITNMGFSTNDVNNYDTDKYLCNYGSLIIRGVLIGDNLENMVTNRRSHLNTRFNVYGDEEDVKSQRRDKIFEGASVLIEYNPSLRTKLPPGTEYFTETLEVYKK